MFHLPRQLIWEVDVKIFFMCPSPPRPGRLHSQPPRSPRLASPKLFVRFTEILTSSQSRRLPKSQHQSGIKTVEKPAKSLFRPIKKPSKVPRSIIGISRSAQHDQFSKYSLNKECNENCIFPTPTRATSTARPTRVVQHLS